MLVSLEKWSFLVSYARHSQTCITCQYLHKATIYYMVKRFWTADYNNPYVFVLHPIADLVFFNNI